MVFKRLLIIFLLVSFVATANVTVPVAFAESDIRDIYINSYGNMGFPHPNFSGKENTKTEWAIGPNGVNCLHFLQTGTNDAFCDIAVGVEEVTALVIQIDIYPESLEGGKLMVRALGSATHSNVIRTDASGNLIVGTAVIQTLEIGKWTTVSVVCDYTNATGDVYINGDLKKEDVPLHNGAVLPQKLRIGFQSTEKIGNNEVYFNRLKVYEATKLCELDESHLTGEDAMVSINDSREMAIRKLGSDAAYMAHGDFYFQGGKKYKYSETNTAPAYSDENETVMVPAKLLSEGIGEEIVFDSSTGEISANGMVLTVGSTESSDGTEFGTAPVYKDEILYLPAASFARNVFGKYAYEDERGFVLISDKDRNYSNSETPSENTETIDKLYRYLQYERPTGDRIYEDFVKHSKNQHPRIYVRNETEALREKIESNPDLQKGADELLEKCNEYLQLPPTEYNIPDGLRLFAACEKVTGIVEDLYTAYLLTDDEKYRERIWVEVKNALNWKDWNIQNHYLDSGEIAPGVALAYDILQDYLTEEEKSWFRNRLVDLYLDSAVDFYTGSLYLTAKNGKITGSNWGAVIGSGMLLVSLSFMDAEPEDSLFTKKCKFIAENALQTLEYSIGQMFPDGANSEGIGYWSYYVKHISAAITALQNTCGTDYGLLYSPGFYEATDYALYIQSGNGCYNLGSTSGEENIFSGWLFKIADFYNDYKKMEVLNSFGKQIGKKLDSTMIMWYNPSDTENSITDYPLERFMKGQNIFVARSSWTDTKSAYLGIRGGKNTVGGQFDKGSFIFEGQGVRWFVDLGKENQNIEGGYYNEAGWTLYRKRAEGHNAVVINPTAEDPGQTVDSVASLKKLERKEKGVIAVYNLADVYADDVNYYDRAFYLGEERNTLIVQDEMELKTDENDIYMFLHTKGKITVDSDGKGAIVEKDGKKVKVDVICDADRWCLVASDASPLFPENARPDEISRADYQRLTLVGKAGGKLNISTKITPYEDGNTYEELSFVPYSKWTIPDGELVRSLKPEILSPLVLEADDNGMVEVDISIPYKPEKIEVYLNDELVYTKTEFDVIEEQTIMLNTQSVNALNFKVGICSLYGDDEYWNQKDFILVRPEDKSEILDCDFVDLDNSNIKAELKEKGFTGVFTKDEHLTLNASDGALEIVINDTRSTDCGYIEKNDFVVPSGQVLRLSFDIESDSKAHMFFSSIRIPTAISGRVEMTLDGENYNIYIKDAEGNLLSESVGAYKVNGFSRLRFTFSAGEAGSRIKIKNLYADAAPKQEITGITRIDGKISLSLLSGAEKIIAASYDEDMMSEIYFSNEEFIEFPDHKVTKVFIWDSELRPLKKCLQF